MSLVTVQLFSESLCPDCINYAQTSLAPAMASLSPIISLEVYPYGNAEETQNADGSWQFDCQHGDNECTANLYEACAIKHFPKVDDNNVPQWYPFFECMESSDYNLNRYRPYNTSVAIGCSDDAGIDWDTITTCAEGDEGNVLMHGVALATPNHTYVPWVVINGETVPDSGSGYPAGNLTELVCAAYGGDFEGCN
ncbi:hypothetical protein TL16_g03828 [Triparma laevis f. inornata]|uniref:Gamma-interferon-inducible lysosomal thiol reductase n=1 Tax=Triparma laevis f. inornata TaxID=1714386 RepID=A0A9W7E0W0_9STRA|nr:hypothetical protein TL16_g03828 [Triparma laevis f. inornata]